MRLGKKEVKNKMGERGWVFFRIRRCLLTSAEHFATAVAKVSIGRVRPGIIDGGFVTKVGGGGGLL